MTQVAVLFEKIKVLEAQLDNARQVEVQITRQRDIYYDESKSLLAENARLREALGKIEGYCNDTKRYGDGKLIADILKKEIQKVLK